MIIPDHIPKYNRGITFVETLNVDTNQVWRILSSESNLELFHPFCEVNPTGKWPGKGSVDEVHYLNGWIFEREFHAWHEGEGYDLIIGRKYGRKSYVSWRIIPSRHPSSCKVSITIYPFIFNTRSKFLETIPFLLFIKPKLKSYLQSVLGGLKWYTVNQVPIPKNHFGKHSWFSK